MAAWSPARRKWYLYTNITAKFTTGLRVVPFHVDVCL